MQDQDTGLADVTKYSLDFLIIVNHFTEHAVRVEHLTSESVTENKARFKRSLNSVSDNFITEMLKWIQCSIPFPSWYWHVVAW